MADMQLSIVVPAFEEQDRLPATLDRLGAELDGVVGPAWEIVVSDDGSTDATPRLVEERARDDARIRLVRSEVNRGKGAALRSGARAAGLDLVAFVDADLPVPVATLGTLAARADRLDIVVGSRRIAGASFTRPQPLARRIGGRGFLLGAHLLGYQPGSDPQCGVKLLRRSSVMPVLDQVTCEGFAFDIELLTRAQRAGLRVGEAPVEWAHVPGSSVRPVRDALATLRDLAALRRHLPRPAPGGVRT